MTFDNTDFSLVTAPPGVVLPNTADSPYEIASMVLPPGGWYEVLSTQLTKTTSLLEIRFFSEKHGRQKQTNK